MVEEGLWVADQITDRLALIEIGSASEYGVTRLIRDFPTDSSNTSGMAVGDGCLWLAANGDSGQWRSPRSADALADNGEILRIGPSCGKTLRRYPVPGGGGVHGIEYDQLDPGHLWVTTLKDQPLSKVRIADWSVRRVVSLPYERALGVVRTMAGVCGLCTRVGGLSWCWTNPVWNWNGRWSRLRHPHGLSVYGDGLLYCDAPSGWVVRVRC